ncbi:MAG: RDD family protein [Planctomycetes bacterium]|nr:RDD family protein [Planctomycetota bacterium]
MPDPAWLSRDLVITTPEAVDFTYDLAGPSHRFLAWLVDSAVILIFIFGLIFTSALVAPTAGLMQAVFITASFATYTGYYIVLESIWHGQTVGKRVAGIRVIDSRGFRVSPGQCAVRNLFRLFDGMPLFYLVGGVTMLLSRRGLRLGDMAAGTVVVRILHLPSPERLLPPGERSEALLGDFALGERVRRTLASREKDLLISLAVRRERLEERARMALFTAAAGEFEKRLDIARPSTMSPERYILNLAAIAHAPRDKDTGLIRR